jgi:hypothetical protein
MSMPDHIARIRPDPDSLDFDTLKEQGIALVQDLSGNIWTDYNPHDPGITILEQLCYGLTDLAFRSELEVKDYLAGKNGEIDFDKQALFRPQDIFPSQAVTANDYRKILYDAIPEIDDIWFKVKRGKGLHANGLYSVFVKLDGSLDRSTATTQRRQEIGQEIVAAFSSNRNLCEDIDQVHIVKAAPYYLTGEIEVGGRDPAKIFADIFFQCSKQISSAVRIERYEDVFATGKSREEIFSGPLTNHGYISEELLEAPRDSVSTVKLIALIRRIDGVKQVRNLGLKDEQGNMVDDISCNPSMPTFPELCFPDTQEQKEYLRFVFSKSTRTKSPATSEPDFSKETSLVEGARLELKKLKFEFQAFRANRDTIDRFVTLPRGQQRDLQTYYSIQNQFPAIYGINRYGVPESASDERKAKARQLKAYLYPYEQLMANYLQNLHGISQLFSIDDALQKTYFSQYLDNRIVPEIERLYENSPMDAGQAAMAIVSHRDNFSDRRSRVLDTLLAMYGEDFAQESLALYNYYHAEDAEHWLIEKKINYLKNLPNISRNRTSAFDYAKPSWTTGNITGFQKKISLLLGMQAYEASRSLTDEILSRKISLTADESNDKAVDMTDIEGNFNAVCAMPANAKEAKAALSIRHGALTESMFSKGVSLNNFLLLSRNEQEQTAVFFRANENGPLWRLSDRKNEQDANLFAHQFRNAIVQLNEASEGLHVVEHLLLRPRGAGVVNHENVMVPPDFYSARISIIFPSWTARFSDLEFRKFAQETVCRNLAAHIYPEFYWLDFKYMCIFEKYYKNWLEHLQLQTQSNSSADFTLLNDASEKLISLLLTKKSQDVREYWI